MAYQPKSYRKFIAGAATAAVVASSFAGVAGAASNFTDVNDNYKEAVDFLVSKGINGLSATEFGTYNNIKRVDAAVFVVKALGLDVDAAPASGFTDVPERAVKEVNALKAAGITSGKTATTFDSQALITRGELAIWLDRAFELEGEADISKFTDATGIYTEAIEALVANKITNGTTATTFGTKDNAKRGDFAIFIKRAADTLDKDEKPVDPTVVTSVKATTTEVDAAQDEAQLELTINNGDKVTVQDLYNNGFEVQFIIQNVDDADVVDFVDGDDTRGKVEFTANAKEGEKFKYQVVVTKDGQSVYSNVQEVSLVDSFNKANSINIAELTVDGVENESGVLSKKSDTTIQFTEVQYTNSQKVKKAFTTGTGYEDNNVKFSSSNPEVAVISKEGAITLVNTGKTTITVEVAGLKKQVSITVNNEERKPSKVTSEYSSVKVAPSTSRNVEFVVRDQFGDAIQGVALESQVLKVDDDTIATLSFGEAVTDVEGKVSGTLAGTKAGKGNLSVYAKYTDVDGNDKTTASLVKLPVEVTGVNTVKTYKLEKVNDDESFELDAYAGAYDELEDQKVTLRVNKYNASSTLLGKVTLTGDETAEAGIHESVEGDAEPQITVTTQEPAGKDVIAVTVEENGDLKITPLRKGTATVYVKDGDLTIASQTITVKDTTPEITAITFNTLNTVTETAPIEIEDVIDVTKVTVANKVGVLRLTADGEVLYLDQDNDNNFEDTDIKVADVTVEPYGIEGITINESGEITGFAADQEGNVIVKVTSTRGEKLVFTKSITVEIPE